jgi:hypothetical protein
VALTYELVTRTPAGKERSHEYASAGPLGPGDVVRLDGRDWLVERVDPPVDGGSQRASAVLARYRLHLRHPDGREEVGAFRRFRPDAPRLGHAFTTLEDGSPASWEVVEERMERDESGQAYLDLLAERDYGELEELPDHQLEHALASREERLPEAATATFARAEQAGLLVELVALEPGEEPDWAEAARYIDALVLDEIEDDMLEQCGVDPGHDARETWLPKVKERLQADLERFHADVEDDQDEIEEWDFRDGRIFASVGSFEDESNPDSGHGWMCRLVDASALGAAGFARVRKVDV